MNSARSPPRFQLSGASEAQTTLRSGMRPRCAAAGEAMPEVALQAADVGQQARREARPRVVPEGAPEAAEVGLERDLERLVARLEVVRVEHRRGAGAAVGPRRAAPGEAFQAGDLVAGERPMTPRLEASAPCCLQIVMVASRLRSC